MFKLNTKGVEAYTAVPVEGAGATAPEAVQAWEEAVANGKVVTVEGETTVATVTGLEGNKTYTVFFIFKTTANKFEIRQQEINTPNYTSLVTMIETTPFSVKFHVNVDANTYYRVGLITHENYYSMQSMFGRMDVDYTQWDSWDQGIMPPVYKGPQTIELANEKGQYQGAVNAQVVADHLTGVMGEYEEEPYYIHPGTGYVLFVSQCSADYTSAAFSEIKEYGGGDDWGPLRAELPNVKDYTEIPPTSDMVDFKGQYAKTTFFTQQATKGDGSVEIKWDHSTEKTAIMSFTPSETVEQYMIYVMSSEEEEMILPIIGGEDGVQAMALANGQAFEGNQQLMFSVEMGLTYSVYVTAVYPSEVQGSVQSFHYQKGIKALESKNPAVELDVKALTAGELKAMGKDPAYNVGWNVKAPNKDCLYFKYLMNYYEEWILQINQIAPGDQESAVTAMMEMYGQTVADETTLSEVNSAAGTNLIFSSTDETKSWIVLESYNVDEKTQLMWEDDNLMASTSSVTPEDFVGGELYDALQGNWTATVTDAEGNAVDCAVNIAAGPEKVESVAAADREKMVAYYVKNGKTEAQANELIDKYFAEYLELADHYAEKYKNQNMLVATGFAINDMMGYASPYRLFATTSGYNSVSTDDLFRDYGPKLFLKFYKDGDQLKVKIPTTTYTEDLTTYQTLIDPVANWRYEINLAGYNADDATSHDGREFDVEVSADGNTLTVLPAVTADATFAPGFGYLYWGSFQWAFKGAQQNAIVLNRAAAAPANRAASRAASLPAFELKVKSSDNHYRRTRTMYDFEYRKPVEIKVGTVADIKARVQKEMGK